MSYYWVPIFDILLLIRFEALEMLRTMLENRLFSNIRKWFDQYLGTMRNYLSQNFEKKFGEGF